MQNPRKLPSVHDFLHYLTRMVKYWRLACLLFSVGLGLGLIYFVYGKPVYYSRTLIEYSYLDLPIHSEVSDTQGASKYQSISYQLTTALNSRWMVERTAIRLGLVKNVGDLDHIYRRFLQKVRVQHVMNTTLQVEVYAFEPRLVREWPGAMLAEYQEYLVAQRRKFMEVANKGYAEEMERIRGSIFKEQQDEKSFEEKNKVIESYIEQNRIEKLPSEMLTIHNQLDNMKEMEEYLQKYATTTVEKLALLKKYRAMPLPVGTIVQSQLHDKLIKRNSRDDPVPGPNSEQLPQGVSTGPGAGTVVVVPQPGGNPKESWEAIDQQLRALLQKRQQAEKTYLPGHEVMRKLDREIAEAQSTLDTNLASDMKAFGLEHDNLVQKLANLEKQMPEYRKVMADFDEYRRDYQLLTSGKLAWETAYSKLKQRLAAMEHTGPEMKVSFVNLGAVELNDQIPVSPNKMKLLIYGLGLGFAFAIGGPLLLENFRTTTSLVADTERITGLQASGVIPLLRDRDHLKDVKRLVSEDPRCEIKVDEAFRIIRCSLPLYVASDNKMQVIMVCSSRQAEGKTTTSSHLARSFAVAGQKTLLIDGDLRRGRLHQVYEVTNGKGLSDFLDESINHIRDMVQPSGLPLLDLLTRGSESRPKFEVLASSRFEELMVELRAQYDRIIIDTPPLLGLADAMMIQRLVDGALLVVRAERTTQRDLHSAYEILSRSNTPIYGFVLNGVDLSRIENYYYYRTYYPRYYDEAAGLPELSQPAQG